jgi:hypothetical protein
MKKELDLNQRIPMFVESPRGDDKIGTDMNTGSLITDHVASETGVPFQSGVPKEKIQEAIETQLKDNKWVVVEKKDGTSELLTKGDLPEPEKVKEEDEKTGDVEGAGASENDWRTVFSAVPVKPKPGEPTVASVAASTASPVVKPAYTTGPKKETEKWESKFKNIKSATATHKGKGG